MITEAEIEVLLSVIRLGDADRLGWWRSHSVDETAEYVLGHSFPSTWMASGVELAMESARIRHEVALERATAVHLFSDYLPFHHLLKSWLIERKLERDEQPLRWLPDADSDALRSRLGAQTDGQRRGDGLYVGDVAKEQLGDAEHVRAMLGRLGGAYVSLGGDFAAPYLDLVV